MLTANGREAAQPGRVEWTMQKPKPYKCSVCGAEVPNLPMPVLEHQMSPVKRRPFAGVRPKPERPDERDRRPPAERD
jgi:hypothetical protein